MLKKRFGEEYKVEEASPYKGAKPHHIISELDDKLFLQEFIRSTCDELPMLKPKKKKKTKA